MIAKFRSARKLSALAILILQPAGVQARSLSPAQEAKLATCIRQASGGRAWLEKTLWVLRDQEGGWIGADVPNDNGSHDLGPLQVNSSWVPRLSRLTMSQEEKVRTWLINDPCFNVEAARWIFLTSLHTSHDYWKAIGAFHSPTGWRQRMYAAAIAHRLVLRFGESVLAAEHPKSAKIPSPPPVAK